MTVELWLLAACAFLALLQAFAPNAAARSKVGDAWLVGPRDAKPDYPQTASRLWRAHRNMLEYLPIFATLIFILHLTDVHNALTELGAHFFFWSRLFYVPAYVWGVTYMRTMIWLVGIVGLIILFVQLFVQLF